MSEIPNIYQATTTSARRICPAFAKGCGGALITDGVLRPGPIMLFGNPALWQLMKQARSEGRAWYYCDHAYFHRRKYFRITKNAFQHSGYGWADYPRLLKMGIRIEPWKTGGRHILLCPPDPVYSARQGFDEKLWCAHIMEELRQHTDRPIKVRHRVGCERDVPLRDALRDAWALVTHHSNAAVEALCMGYPVFVTGVCAASRMASGPISKIESPSYGKDRREWAATLAANQWTTAEMANGFAWQRLQA